jgi:hypothetical protein
VKFPAIRQRTTVLQMTFQLKVNGTDDSADVPADTPLLRVIREVISRIMTRAAFA